jgi:hypothetical protein
LYCQKAWTTTFTKHLLLTVNHRSNQYSLSGTTIANVPTTSNPIAVTRRDTSYEVKQTEFFLMTPTISDTTNTLTSQMKQLPPSINALLADMELLIPESDLHTALSTLGRLYLASDGGAASVQQKTKDHTDGYYRRVTQGHSGPQATG